MSKGSKHTREPLIYISKRDNVPLKTGILVRVIAILSAVLGCGGGRMGMTGE